MTKDDINEAAIESINWAAIGDAMKEVPRKRRIFISKHICGMCGVGKFMHRWKQCNDSSCPRCGEHEDARHVWTCHGKGADDIWTQSLSELECWMSQVQTDPDVQHAILSHLQSWRENNGEPLPTNFLLDEAVSSQERLGWQRFFEGWIAVEWSSAQQAYYTLMKSCRTGKRWVISLIKKLWDVAWDLWEHRNGIPHNTTNLVSEAELRTLDRKIRSIFLQLQIMSLSAQDRHLLSTLLPRLLKKDRAHKSEWLRNATLALHSRSHAHWIRTNTNAQLIQGMQSNMQRFLYRRDRPDHP
jgi:hypothetical protein